MAAHPKKCGSKLSTLHYTLYTKRKAVLQLQDGFS